MDQLIRKASADRTAVPALAKALLSGHVTIIASWDDPKGTTIKIQDFIRDGQSYIPLFSSEAEFKNEAAGTDHVDKGVSIDATLFAAMLHGHEALVLDPRSATPVNLTAADLKAAIEPSRLPKPDK